jgi:hypothetical protein
MMNLPTKADPLNSSPPSSKCSGAPAADRSAYQRAYYAANREHAKEVRRLWRLKNPDYQRRWAAKNPGKRAAATKKYAVSHPAARAATNAAWKAKNRAKVSAWRRRRAGLPEPTRPQPATCENCNKPPSGQFRELCLDHAENPKRFRGWLCFDCNTSIGKLGDTIAGLRRAIAYLERAGE